MFIFLIHKSDTTAISSPQVQGHKYQVSADRSVSINGDVGS